jgi:DNA-binding transcriptional LysR family regulator
MEIRQLQYFVAMYEEGSVTQAARRLNVVQPALSQQLSKLEAELSQQLFLRTSKGMVPTHAGEEAYGLFRTVLKDLDFARQSLQERKDLVRGQVSIGVVASVLNNALSDTLHAFHVKYPDVRIQATGGYTTELTELLRMSRLDVIVFNAPMHLDLPHTTDILTEEMALICAEDNPRRFDGPVSFEDLARLNLVIPSQRHGLRLIMDKAVAAQNIALSPAFEFDEIRTIEDFVGQTDSFAILPPIAVHRGIRAGRLRYVPITPTIPRRLVWSHNPNRPLSRAAELLIDELRERMIEVKYALEERLAQP